MIIRNQSGVLVVPSKWNGVTPLEVLVDAGTAAQYWCKLGKDKWMACTDARDIKSPPKILIWDELYPALRGKTTKCKRFKIKIFEATLTTTEDGIFLSGARFSILPTHTKLFSKIIQIQS